jgi:ribosomal protein L40E
MPWPEGRRLLHLICLRCNRPNVAEAKFCSECGAGLLRKFCGACHAVNDSESHFCQSCGAALPMQPPLPVPAPAPVPPEATLPSLTDVASIEPEEQSRHLVVAPLQLDAGAIVEVPPQLSLLAAEVPPMAVLPIAKTYRTPILLGLGGVSVLLVAMWLWPRSEFGTGSSAAIPSRAPILSGQGAAVGAAALPALTEAAVPPTLPASAGADPTRPDAAVSPPLPQTLDIAKEPDKPVVRRTPPEVISAARPAVAAAPVATPAPRPRVIKTTPRPSAPARDCTPEVDALGLCAPGTKVTGR